MQSSSLVSVITISFLSAGLVALPAGIGIIFGANIGTTTGAWLMAAFGLKVKLSAYAMPMLVFGIVLVFQKSKNLKGIGYVLAGLGFLFLGISYMKSGFDSFKDTIDLTRFAMTGIGGLLVFTGIGVFATVVMQSSHATLMLDPGRAGRRAGDVRERFGPGHRGQYRHHHHGDPGRAQLEPSGAAAGGRASGVQPRHRGHRHRLHTTLHLGGGRLRVGGGDRVGRLHVEASRLSHAFQLWSAFW